MAGKSLTIEQILPMLAAAPSHIAAVTADLTPEQLRTPPGPGEWSANEVLAHLRSCADVWGNGIALILAEDTPTIRAMNPRTWIKSTDYLKLEFQPSFQAFTTQRTALLVVLESLAAEAWTRKAIVKGAGKTLERTVYTYAESLAIHERPHLKQIDHITKTMRQ